MKAWEGTYNGNTIRVENHWDTEKLIVNNVLQDQQRGLVCRSRLWGKLPTGEVIKVSIGGSFRIHCSVFVDDALLFSK